MDANANTDAKAKKIYERNPDTGVIRWRYVHEKMSSFTWPMYGRPLTPITPEEAAQADG